MYLDNCKIFDTALNLPAEWDSLAGDNPYMRRDFLAFIEKTIPCGQKYYIFYGSNCLPDTVFVTYQNNKFNLGMLTKRKLHRKIELVYFPIWVKRSSIIFGNKRASDALKYIKKIRGFKLLLCLTDAGIKAGYIKGNSAPACMLDIKWKSFDEYMAALRSNYRYRYSKALKKSSGLTIRQLADNAGFSQELYGLYEQVERNAQIKIDKLPLEFFRGGVFKFLVFSGPDGKPAGFVQLLENGDELIFEFTGFDYAANKEYQTYHRMLVEIIRYAIENGFKRIDFGQTADETKLMLGCRYEYLHLYLHHSNPLIRFVYRVMAPFLDYRPLKPNFNVFKEKEED
jgi:transcriptional regulator with XRE-family HTH domain